MNIKDMRKLFPIFQKKPEQYPLVYIDNAATTQKPGAVIDTITNFYTNENGTVHRGVYELSEKARGQR